MRGKKRQNLFIAHKGECYVVSVASGIPTLSMHMDGMTMVKFRGSKHIYLKLSEVTEWHQKEIEFGREESRKMLTLCWIAASKFEELVA